MLNLTKALTLLSPCSPGKPYDPTGFRQLLCPDPLCNVCNTASTQVSHLLSQAPLEEGAALAPPSSPPANRPGQPGPEASPHASLSILSQNQIPPLDGVSSPIPLSTSLSPPATAPLNPAVAHTPRRTFTSFPLLLPNATQEAQLALQAEVPQSPVEGPRELSPNVSTTQGTVYEPASSQPRFRAEDQSLTNLARVIHQQPPDSYTSRGSHQRLSKAYAVEPWSPSPNVLALFKKQEKGDADVTVHKLKKEKTVSF